MTSHATSAVSRRTLVGTLARQSETAVAIRTGSVCLFLVLTAVGAQVSVPLPFTPVPLTVQPMVVLLGGAALGWRLGALAQVMYLVAGAAGLPVFAAAPDLPHGILRLLGPTGGYLLAYPLAAAVTGWLAERGLDRRWVTQVAAMLAGLVVIYAGGVARLAVGPPSPLGLQMALAAGFYPFVLADLTKIAVAAGLLPALWRYVR